MQSKNNFYKCPFYACVKGTICHTSIARTFFRLENYLDSKAQNVTHTQNYTYITQIFWGINLEVQIHVGQQGS